MVFCCRSYFCNIRSAVDLYWNYHYEKTRYKISNLLEDGKEASEKLFLGGVIAWEISRSGFERFRQANR